jgi:hypothetical protein
MEKVLMRLMPDDLRLFVDKTMKLTNVLSPAEADKSHGPIFIHKGNLP